MTVRAECSFAAATWLAGRAQSENGPVMSDWAGQDECDWVGGGA